MADYWGGWPGQPLRSRPPWVLVIHELQANMHLLLYVCSYNSFFESFKADIFSFSLLHWHSWCQMSNTDFRYLQSDLNYLYIFRFASHLYYLFTFLLLGVKKIVL